MVFWVLIVLLTAAAILAVLIPLGRTPAGPTDGGFARRVYVDQLAELERDATQGRISASDAESARVEVARRLLKADQDEAQPVARPNPTARRAVALAALLGMPLLSLSLYLAIGAPAVPGAPLAARLNQPPGAQAVDVALAQVEELLARQPENGDGWDVIAPVYLRVGRASEAVIAYRNAIRLLGTSAERQAGLGNAIVLAEGGVVTTEARQAFEAASALDPTAPMPQFALALAAEQEGDFAGAATRWQALLSQAAADAPWRQTVEEALARALGAARPALPGPTAEDVAAAESMSPDDQNSMIQGMVAGLAERLQNEPDDADGWLMLIRSYTVLGDAEAASEAARDALDGVEDEAGRQRIQSLLAELEVAPGPPTAAASEPPVSTREEMAAAENPSPDNQDTTIPTMVAGLAERLKTDTGDVDGWLLLIRSYAVLGDPDAAAGAARDALDGVEDPAGRERIQSLLADLDVTPASPTATAPAAAPPATSPPALPGPTAEDVAAAQSLSPDDQNAMIQGMVAGLAERLQNEPDDVDGWLMLIRSYTVLDDGEAAAQAARDALDGVEDPAGRQRIESLLAELDVTPTEAP